MRKQLLEIGLDNFNINLKVNVFLLAFLFLIPLIWVFLPRIRRLNRPDVELQVKLGGIGQVKIKPNHEVRQIAHKAWVELKTRKAGLPIDKENDVIGDIYKSWYMLFGEIRMLAREVPAHQLKDPDTGKLVELLVDSLNNGLRPHLTQWRAKYSWWYDKAIKKEGHDELTPQDIQKKFPQYKELVDDMLKINQQLVQYTDEIKKLIDA